MKYDNSPKGKLRYVKYTMSEKGHARSARQNIKTRDYRRDWNKRATQLIGSNYRKYWGLYKLLKNLPNAEIVEVTID